MEFVQHPNQSKIEIAEKNLKDSKNLNALAHLYANSGRALQALEIWKVKLFIKAPFKFPLL